MRMMEKKSKWTTYAKCVYPTTYVVKKKVEFFLRRERAHWMYFLQINDYVSMLMDGWVCVMICIYAEDELKYIYKLIV